jgi:hypothetical protein
MRMTTVRMTETMTKTKTKMAIGLGAGGNVEAVRRTVVGLVARVRLVSSVEVIGSRGLCRDNMRRSGS